MSAAAEQPPKSRAVCHLCGEGIMAYSKAHELDPHKWVHCKCNGCAKSEWGDFLCIPDRIGKKEAKLK